MTRDIRLIWLALAAAAGGAAALLGVPEWRSAAWAAAAAAPPAAALFMRGSMNARRALEVESALAVGVAAAGAALSGGAGSPLTVAFALAVALAWRDARHPRLALEIAGFALLGLALAHLAASAFPGRDEGAGALAACFAVAALAALGGLALEGRRPEPGAAKAKPADAAPAYDLTAALERSRRSAEIARRAQGQAAEAQEALRARMRFFAQTSHELRTPLNAILGFAEMMRRGVFGPLPERYQEHAELIEQGGRDLALVVDDLLDLARIEAGRQSVAPDWIDLAGAAREAARMFAPAAQRRRIDLVVQGGDAAGEVEAFADARAARQIALNLISNAVKFTPEGGRVTVRATRSGRAARLEVADTGPGMSAEELERLSRPWEQGEAGRRVTGSGLGLSVVRALAELHGGRLDLASRAGAGAVVAVTLPDPPDSAPNPSDRRSTAGG